MFSIVNVMSTNITVNSGFPKFKLDSKIFLTYLIWLIYPIALPNLPILHNSTKNKDAFSVNVLNFYSIFSSVCAMLLLDVKIPLFNKISQLRSETLNFGCNK